MIRRAGLALLFCLAPLVQAAFGQSYPERPIRIIRPIPPVAPTTRSSVSSQRRCPPSSTHPIIIDNRGGAGGKIGAEAVAHATPDGYTLLAGSVSTHSFAPVVAVKLNYDPIKDFEPISLIALVQNLLVVNPKLSATTVQELVALAKRSPKSSITPPAGRIDQPLRGRDVHRARRNPGRYRPCAVSGGGPAMTATIAGDTQFFFSPIAGMVPFVEAGSVRPLAVSGDMRSPALPQVPTIGEAGMPRYKAVGWFGLMARPARPPISSRS